MSEMDLTGFNPPCARCSRCGVSRPINLLKASAVGSQCVSLEHCTALLLTTPSKPAENSGVTAETNR